MNSPDDLNSDAARREWEAQEQALRDARSQVDVEQSSPIVQQYRLIADALRDPPIDPMPRDFAARTAQRVQRSLELEDDRFESWLQQAFVALLAVAGIASVFYFADPFRRAIDWSLADSFAPGSSLVSWIVSGTLCLLASAAFDFWSRRHRADQH